MCIFKSFVLFVTHILLDNSFRALQLPTHFSNTFEKSKTVSVASSIMKYIPALSALFSFPVKVSYIAFGRFFNNEIHSRTFCSI